MTLLDDGSYAILPSKDGCFLMKLSGEYESIRLFHDVEVNPFLVQVVPTNGPLLLLCAYASFCSLWELSFSSNTFASTIKQSYYGFQDRICCSRYLRKDVSIHCLVDVQKDCFIIGEFGGYLHLQYYNQKQPSACLSVQEIEKQAGMKSFNLRWREIRHISFDHTFNENLFAIMTAELCCVYDITNPTTPISILTVHNCLVPIKKSNVVVQFHSFAFCGNGQMLVITDKDVFRWDYFHSDGKTQTLSSVYHQSNKSSFRRISFKPNGNLIGTNESCLDTPSFLTF